MNKLYTLFLLLILSVTSTYGQTYVLDLSKAKLPVLPAGYAVSEVIDAREEKNKIGFVQRTILNVQTPAVLASPLAEALYTFIDAQQSKQPNYPQVILRVQHLWISEATAFSSETGTAELAIDFIYKQDSIYRKLYAARASHTFKGLEVTYKHADNIAKALGKCLQEFNTQDFNAMLSQAAPLTSEQLSSASDATTAAAASYPILQADAKYKRGIYTNLNEFLNNAPGITANFEVKQRSDFDQAMVGGGDVLPVLINRDGTRTKIKNAWGFTDGTQLYFNAGEGYYPLTFKNGAFKFVSPPIHNNGSAAVAASAAAGGLVGGLVAGSIMAATTKDVEYTLDLETGAIKYGNTPIGATSKPAKLILYREQKQEQYKAMVVYLNDQPLTLETNQFYEFELNTKGPNATLCLDGDQAACQEFLPVPGKTYYYACIYQNILKPELKQVDERQAEFALKGIKFAIQKAEKQKGKK